MTFIGTSREGEGGGCSEYSIVDARQRTKGEKKGFRDKYRTERGPQGHLNSKYDGQGNKKVDLVIR